MSAQLSILDSGSKERDYHAEIMEMKRKFEEDKIKWDLLFQATFIVGSAAANIAFLDSFSNAEKPRY